MIQRCAGAEEDVRSWHKFPDDGFTERQKHSESRPSGNGEIDEVDGASQGIEVP
jgi:hypothetical protein